MVRAAERALLTIGVLCLAVFAFAELRAWDFARREDARLRPLLRDDSGASAGRARAAARAGRAFGRLEFPARGYSALVAEGVDDDTLRLAVGHMPGPAFPG